MSTAGGPKTTTTGLAYAMDAADRNSFRGEPTTNLATNPQTLTSNFTASATAANGTNLNFTGEFNAGTVTGAGWFARTGTGGSGTNGVRYTTSWYLKAGTTTSVNVDWGGSHQGNITILTVNLINGSFSYASAAAGEAYGIDRMPNDFWRVWYSSTLTTGTLYYPQLTLGSGNIIVGGIQIEQRSYPTSFVNGTRGTTVATGGGLADMSGNSGHGELLNNPREDFNLPQSISFDGTDDRITISNGTQYRWGTSPNSNSFSIEAWINISTTKRNPVWDYYSYGLEATAGGKMNLWYKTAASWYSLLSNASIATGTWYHIVGTHTNAGTDFIYVNGILDSSAAADSVSTIYNWFGPYLGYTDHIGGVWTAGKISACKVYNRQLTAQEVLQNYNSQRRRYSV